MTRQPLDRPGWIRLLRAVAGPGPAPPGPLGPGEAVRWFAIAIGHDTGGHTPPHLPGTGLADAATSSARVAGELIAPSDAGSDGREPLRSARTPGSGRPLLPGPAGGELDAILWRAVVDPRIDPAASMLPGSGPLFETEWFGSVEVWTETELCALHALWRVARVHGDERWRARAIDACRWHLEYTQPDNATHRPWAVHVFLLGGGDLGRLYAETLVHNVQASHRATDALAAAILRDAAEEIELEPQH